ncbi:hypothethical protein [Ralstonia solanacearum PSI07]|uniref:Uncharacterized protein n=1 Tax=blood disease bacterium R229 TaxID=741978 RepID=G2ZN21_9RALS|nr:hypothethical protein [Ralstonia solanacearum PSI07]CCA80440.1 conserved hypothetical protein [blood disease bacterium R229]
MVHLRAETSCCCCWTAQSLRRVDGARGQDFKGDRFHVIDPFCPIYPLGLIIGYKVRKREVQCVTPVAIA